MLAAGLALLLAGGPARAQQQMVILELFTSQGCNSCPPADAMMADWEKLPGVLPLSLHVDYWDYLGWRDTFGKKGHSSRQQGYAQSMGSRQVYTPQAVIDGQFQAVGSNRAAVLQAVKDAEREKRVVLQAKPGKTGWQIGVPAVAGWQGEAKLLLCLYDREHQVPIARGENAGRTMTYLNVARSWNDFGRWKGQAETYALPDLGDIDWSRQGAVVMLQSLKGPIIGAVDLRNGRGL
ncbi:DUF1223 domain-containing protein [Ferrovibrio sp.]|uniref:DUF1223 domain-containing protein n=1 Tax=Ferrovibrio sp. TaxID=1917215 RepID=UPI00311D453E